MAIAVEPISESTLHEHTVPRLHPGTELLGAYEGSGFTTPQFLIQRHDAQVIRVSQLLYLITAQMDGRNDLEAIARRVSTELDRIVTASDVAHLVENKLDRLGILDGRSTVATGAVDPMLGLRMRTSLVPERVHRRVTNALCPLFRPLVVATVLIALVAADAWVAMAHRSVLLNGWIEILTRPGLFLGLTGATVAAMAFHEFGHAAACRYGGGRPGAMGAGIYLVWPAFFTDVSDAYRLDRRGRLRTDLGGIYFNAIFSLIATGGFAATGFAPLVVLALLIQAQALYQLVPIVRLDGYYILGDLIGVPNPFAFVRATIVSLFAPRRSAARANARASLGTLRRSARFTLTLWILVAIPVLLAALALSLYLMPRSVPALVSALRLNAAATATGVGERKWIGVANGVVQFVFLVLPLFGWLISMSFIGKQLGAKFALGSRIRGLNPRQPLLAMAAAILAVGALAVTLHTGESSRPTLEAAPSSLTTPTPAELLPPFDLGETADATRAAVRGAVEEAAPHKTSTPPAVVQRAAEPTPTRWTLTKSVAEVNALANDTPQARTTIGMWLVQPGDDFWKISEQILTDAYQRAPTPTEHHGYWAELVEANRHRLVQSGDASTIFSGQEFEVILPALGSGHTHLFGDHPDAPGTAAAQPPIQLAGT